MGASPFTRVAAAACLVCLAGCGASEGALPLGAHADDCGACHSAIHAEWSASRHAASTTSPLFVALLPRVAEAWGAVARDRCVVCHAPGHGGDEGIGCVTCHAAVGNRGEQNGALVVDLDAPIAGPFADAEATLAHRTATRSFLDSSVLCGTCHEVRGPGLFDEPTLSEYRGSAQAASGTSCVDCHMPALDPAPIADGAPRSRARREHRFVGIDPAWGATPEAQARAADDARDLLGAALELSVRQSDPTHAELVLANVGAGHDVPTGAAFLRDIWVDVRVIDARGHVFELPRVIELGARMLSGEREVALPTEADRIVPRGIAPGDRRTALVELPAGATAPMHVAATVRARAVRPDTLASLGLPALPLLEIASASTGP